MLLQFSENGLHLKTNVFSALLGAHPYTFLSAVGESLPGLES